jgi:hypothetical protein
LELVDEGGTIKKGGGMLNGTPAQFKGVDLIVSPGAKISEKLQILIRDNGGSIREFDLETKQIKVRK